LPIVYTYLIDNCDQASAKPALFSFSGKRWRCRLVLRIRRASWTHHIAIPPSKYWQD